MNLTLAEIASMTQASIIPADPHVRVTSVSTDTRSLLPGALFVALVGERVDGHDLLEQAKQRGATAALVQRLQPVDLPQIVLPKVELGLANLARAWIKQMPAKRIALTGSNGKTTVKNLITSILQHKGSTLATAGNLNNELGLPLTVLNIRAEHQFAVLEMGAGKPGDIEFLMSIAPSHISLVNNAMAAHLERLGSIHGVAVEKSAVYRGLLPDGTAIINADDGECEAFLKNAASANAAILRCSIAHRQAEFSAGNIKGSTFKLHTPQGELDIRIALLGQHNVANAVMAAAACFAAGASLEQIKQGLENAPAAQGRLQLIPQPAGYSVINDSYNANPGSVKAAIDALVALPGDAWLALGNMAELGPDAAMLHAEIGAYARTKKVKRVFCVGPHAKTLAESAGSIATAFDDIEQLIAVLKSDIRAGVNLLIKGSRSARMERVLEGLNAHVSSPGLTNAETH
jgi:UDP-N-acetylmuramoyl-tripeptide--D-alanyl-D-alanine ligase